MFYRIVLWLALFFFSSPQIIQAQCPTCGNGIVNSGETNFNCPQDVPHGATCTSPCSQPAPYELASGIRVSYDFTGTTTWSTSGLPSGWGFAGAPTASTAGALPAADAYGAKAGLIQPNCSGSCTATNGFCIGSMANLVSVGAGGTLGKLGANFDGRPNVSQNLSYAVLRGQNNPTLVSETFNFSGVEGFKIQFWLFPSQASCGQLNSWSGCVGNAAFLDFSTDGGTSWSQILQMDLSTANSDMCTNSSTNTLWLKEGVWSRTCLTVYKSATSPGNFYPAANATTAPSGIMVNPAFFTSNFKFRIRYAQTASCTSGISTTNPGRYLAIDYPVITSGNQMIPCGISFINMCGYGADNNDDGVGSSTLTTNNIVYGTVRSSVNQAEKGVEIFLSQTAAYAGQNLSGSTSELDLELCNAEGGDKQCIDWRTNNLSYWAIYECLVDWEAPTGNGIGVTYYKGTTPQTVGMTKVSGIGQTPTLGWRYGLLRYVNCDASSNLNPGCNGYFFQSASLPAQFARSYYNLGTNNSGQSWAFYGSASCMNYFNGPNISPLTFADKTPGYSSYLACNGSTLVFSAVSEYSSNSTGFTGTPTVTVTGPNGFSDVINSGALGTVPVTDTGDYTITPNLPPSPAQCMSCARTTCVTVSSIDLGHCIILPVQLQTFSVACQNSLVTLRWQTASEVRNDYFEVQRSANATDFYTLTSIPGQADNSSGVRDYQYVDEDPLPDVGYYRLKQVDLNDSISYSPVRRVSCRENESNLQIYPNPVDKYMHISWPARFRGRYTLDIYNTAGLLVQRHQNELVSGSSPQTLNLGAIATGLYFLLVRDEMGEMIAHQRFVVH